MINRILVPLDGSQLAECVLPYAEEMGQKLGAEVVLVSITDRVKAFLPLEDLKERYGIKMIPETVCTPDYEAGQYLDAVKQNLEKKGIKVSKEIICGKTAEEIVVFADTQNIDIVIMSSHGKNGPGKLTHGKVLQDVLKKSRIPVMVIKGKDC